VAQHRLHLTPEGQVVLALRHRWADGMTRVIFDPPERLAADAAATDQSAVVLRGVRGAVGMAGAPRPIAESR